MNVLRLERRARGADVFIDDVSVIDDGLAPDARELVDELRRLDGRARLRVCTCGEAGCWSLTVRVRREANVVVWDDWADGVDGGGRPSDSVEREPVRFQVKRYLAVLDAFEPSL